MKKRDVFLFLSFAALFVLFAIFQNFSFPTKQLDQLSKKAFFHQQIKKFVPTYAFNSYIGEIETPYGYKEEIERKIASDGAPIIFDGKKFLKDGVKTLPVYKEIKNIIDINSADDIDAGAGIPCVNNPQEPQNNCRVEYSNPSEKNSSLRVKANPMRQTASISVSGDIESQMIYMAEKKSVQLHFKKELSKDSGVKLEINSQDQSGTFKYDVRW